MIFWRIAYRNVKKNWRHSLSALLSLSASFVSLVLFDGYIDDLKLMYEDSFRHRSMLGDLIIERPQIHSKAGLAEPWLFSLNEADQAAIAEPVETERRVDWVGFILRHSVGKQISRPRCRLKPARTPDAIDIKPRHRRLAQYR